jgi:hypothetical protein
VNLCCVLVCKKRGCRTSKLSCQIFGLQFVFKSEANNIREREIGYTVQNVSSMILEPGSDYHH